MSENLISLETVRAPSGALVLGMAGWIDQWRTPGPPLSERAKAAAAAGGGHLREWLCEAVAVPAAGDRPLVLRAGTSPSPSDGRPSITTLEIDLGLPWPETADPSAPHRLGDLPVDRCGMVVGDAAALDAWTGTDGEPADGLADVSYWGLYADEAHARFGGLRIGRSGVSGPLGWLDLPLAEATARAAGLTAWCDGLPGNGLMVAVDPHTDAYLFRRAGWQHPLRVGAIEVGGCPVLGIAWDQGDHSMRHRGERHSGRVYPVTLEAAEAGTKLLRWTIPPHAPA
ncbi:hypothetical protein [Streptomyces sp. NPDC047014]|uniref:hypothetical protein n=1 Tax=Streptomyces sp. NPDC047014 TaxID=3155736 RepID=UPI0033E45139